MKILTLSSILILTLYSIAAATAALSVSATTSSVPCGPTGVPLCPRGDFGWITVTVTDVLGSPLDVLTCTATGPFVYAAGQNPQSLPWALAGVTFTFKRIGGCGWITFVASSSDGTFTPPTTPIYVSNPDINATGTVNGTDLVLFAGQYGSANRDSDYNCSGWVDGVDLTLFAAHYGDTF